MSGRATSSSRNGLSAIIRRSARVPRKFSTHIQRPVVSVSVGENPEHIFYVHEDLLTDHSDYMRVALERQLHRTRRITEHHESEEDSQPEDDDRSDDGDERSLALPGLDPQLFGFFIMWLYTWKGNDNMTCFEIDNLTELVGLYILGEDLRANDFKNFICSCLGRRWAHQEEGPAYFHDMEPMRDLINAAELVVCKLDEDPDNDFQTIVLKIFGFRGKGSDGWEDNPYFMRRLRQNADFASKLLNRTNRQRISDGCDWYRNLHDRSRSRHALRAYHMRTTGFSEYAPELEKYRPGHRRRYINKYAPEFS